MWMPRAALSIRATNRKISRVANEFNVRSEKRTTYDRSVYHAKMQPVKKNFSGCEWRWLSQQLMRATKYGREQTSAA